jgi:malonate decarboxylase gamma subunit
MNKLEHICKRIFPQGHHISINEDMVTGCATTSVGEVAIIGTTNQAAIGVEIAFKLADKVLEIIKNNPKQPIIILVDTQGQKLSKKDELLGNAGYLSHLSKCFELARINGHRIVSIIYNEAVSGGYLVLGMVADQSFASSDAQIRVMALPAMSRITQIPLERLEELCRSSSIFGPGVKNYISLGAIEDVSDAQLSAEIERALKNDATEDTRARFGSERGGRNLAYSVINSVVNAE